MADNRLLLETPAAVGAGDTGVELPDGAKVPGVKTAYLNDLVQWIPIETIGVYIFLQSLFSDPLNPGPGQQLHELDFGSRWVVFAIGLVLTIVSVPLYTALKARRATANFKFPIGETVLGTIAFILWACALPDTPAEDWKWWNPDYGVAAIAISAVLLAPTAELLNLKAQWGKTPDAGS